MSSRFFTTLACLAALATSAAAQTQTISPYMSTFIKFNTNQVCYGAYGVDCGSLKVYEDGVNNRHTYMKFDVPLECGRRAASATLNMYRDYQAGSGTAMLVKRVASNWNYTLGDPLCLDWNNPPAVVGATFPRTIPYVNNTWIQIDFTDIVNEALAAGEPILSVVLEPDYPAANRLVARFVGMAHGTSTNFPYLSVTWDVGGQCTPFGTACAGGLSAQGSTFLGQSFDIMGWAPSGIGALYMGLSDQTWGGIVLPVDLSGFGFTGCWMNVGMEIPFYTGSVGTSAAAPGTLTVPVPQMSMLVGQSLFFQYYYPDPTLVVGTSEGLKITFGA